MVRSDCCYTCLLALNNLKIHLMLAYQAQNCCAGLHYHLLVRIGPMMQGVECATRLQLPVQVQCSLVDRSIPAHHEPLPA